MESKLFEKKWALPELSPAIRGIGINQSGTKIAACFKPEDNEIQIVGNIGNILETLSGHRKPVKCVRFHPMDNIIASASEDCTVGLWDFEAKRNCRLNYFSDIVEWVDWSFDGNFLAACGIDGSVVVWDRRGDFISELNGADGELKMVKWSPDSAYISAASNVGLVCVWNIVDRDAVLLKHGSPVISVSWSPSGEKMVTVAEDGVVRLWEAATWELAELTGSGNTIFADFSADGNYLAIGGS
ncbi:MAG: hypothetical protein GY855_01560, partial [candidate division Zixibacteria bacterium]|nr:hypothetical protein [candidate division Zixibacteria bacterium]